MAEARAGLEALLHFVETRAKDTVASGRQHIPVFLLLDRELHVIEVVGIPVMAPETKNLMGPLIGKLLAKQGVGGYCFISENWLVIREPDDPRAMPRGSLEKEPDRLEIITAEVGCADGFLFTRTWRIEREPAPPHLVRMNDRREGDGWQSTGRLTQFYRWTRPHAN